MNNVHIVAKGDSLSKISKLTGVSIAELKTLNKLPDPNKLEIGQKIYLKKENVLGFRALILDKDRNPIKELAYQFEFAGRLIKGITGPDGLTKKIMTKTAEDQVRILLQRLDASFKEVAIVASGYGNKLVTLVSPSVKVEAKTEPHPNVTKGTLPKTKEKVAPIHDPKTKQTPTTGKKDLGVTAKVTKTPDGKPVVIVEGDIPDVSFLADYVGGEVTNQDIEDAAKDLKCDADLIFAIAKQESGHSSFLKIGTKTVPTILYERHWFRKLTKPSKSAPSPYEEKYHDICGPAYHIAKKKTIGKAAEKKSILVDQVTGEEAKAADIYGSPGLPQYRRLVKAYQLDKSAALQACSWGKFQIMGFNYKNAGFGDVFAFVKAMCSGDPAHIKAFLKFAKSNPILLDGLRKRNYEKIAEGHNGASWKTINKDYAKNIEKFSKEYKK